MENSNNSYWCQPWTELVYYYGHIYPAVCLFIFGLTFNPIALYYFATSKHFSRTAYAFYFSAIAIVDWTRLILWSLFLFLDYKVFRLDFYSFECSMQLYTESVASSISAWLTVALAVERSLVIYNPFQTLTDIRGKRPLLIILLVVFTSATVNSLFLQPSFYSERVYDEALHSILCFYKTDHSANTTRASLLTDAQKQTYIFSIIIIRVVIPFVLLLAANIFLFITLGFGRSSQIKLGRTSLVRHGHHRQATPMIFFSSCILLLTISPRYLLQGYLNYLPNQYTCVWTNFAPHLLKTCELFNYSLNVFVSIVSGKNGRRELFDMLFCRVKRIRSPRSKPRSLTTTNRRTLSRFNRKNDEQPNHLNHKDLLIFPASDVQWPEQTNN